jgi:putative ABC transport system ATP-binding protein
MLFKIENLNLVYDIGKDVQTYALRDINLSLEGNRLIGIMGPSGSGKSSLLYALAGLKMPTSGSISYNGAKYNELSKSQSTELRRKDFGFIFQR